MRYEYFLKWNFLLGTPETKRNGLNTLNARRAFTSKPSGITFCKTVLSILYFNKKKINQISESPIDNIWGIDKNKLVPDDYNEKI